MGENRVRTNGQYLYTKFLELGIADRYRGKLCWSNKGKIRWIETHHHPFPAIVRKLNRLDLTLVIGLGLKLGGHCPWSYTHSRTSFGILVIYCSYLRFVSNLSRTKTNVEYFI